MPNLAHRLYWSAYLAERLIGQARYPYAAPERIARDRDRNLRRMVAYAHRHVPYYRELFERLGLAPDDIQTFDDLRKLPLISVADLQRDPEAFRSTEIPDGELLAMASSGSTGNPHTVWHDLASLYVNLADGERERTLMQRAIGRRLFYRSMTIGVLTGQAVRVRKVARDNALWPRWLAPQQPRVPAPEGLAHTVEHLNSLKPDVLKGYGSTLAELFLHLDASGAPFHHPGAIRYNSDALPEAARAMIVGKYGIEVFSGYQSVEALRLAWECEAHQGYHINADHYPTRIVDSDGCDVAPGETGEVVICNLTNRGTVLLNYRMGDLAERIDAPCPCGRNLPRIGTVQGRNIDALLTSSGQRVYAVLLARAIREVAGVWQWQAVQATCDRLLLQVRLAPDCDREAVTRALATAVRTLLGEPMAVEVRCVDEIVRTPAGKLRYVINEAQPEA